MLFNVLISCIRKRTLTLRSLGLRADSVITCLSYAFQRAIDPDKCRVKGGITQT
jgi:hypothetical protein